MAKDRLSEMVSTFKGFQDDSAQFSAEIDALLEERPSYIRFEDVKDLQDTQKFLADRYAFYEEMIARLLAGAPMLLGH